MLGLLFIAAAAAAAAAGAGAGASPSPSCVSIWETQRTVAQRVQLVVSACNRTGELYSARACDFRVSLALDAVETAGKASSRSGSVQQANYTAIADQLAAFEKLIESLEAQGEWDQTMLDRTWLNEEMKAWIDYMEKVDAAARLDAFNKFLQALHKRIAAINALQDEATAEMEAQNTVLVQKTMELNILTAIMSTMTDKSSAAYLTYQMQQTVLRSHIEAMEAQAQLDQIELDSLIAGHQQAMDYLSGILTYFLKRMLEDPVDHLDSRSGSVQQGRVAVPPTAALAARLSRSLRVRHTRRNVGAAADTASTLRLLTGALPCGSLPLLHGLLMELRP